MIRFYLMSVNWLHFGVTFKKHGMFMKNLTNRFCSEVELPELPSWFKSSKVEPSHLDLDDDFLLPTQWETMECKTNAGSVKAQYHKDNVQIMTQEITDPNVDEVSNILKSNFTSPGQVVAALGSCWVQISEDLVSKILKRFSNNWVPAFGFFLWADAQIRYKHSPESYNMMVDILGKSKQFDLIWGLIKEMVEVGGLVSVTTMTKVMRRLAGAGRWNEAMQTFHDLEKFGVEKDIVSMNVLLDTLCKERSVRRGRDAFLELRKEIPPNATSFNVLIHGWCKARKLEEAQETMMDMRQSGFRPCVITYTSLIEAYCLEKNFQTVYSILDEMNAQGCRPNVVTYTIVMHSLGKANRMQEALKIFDQMKREGCVPDTSSYNSLIYILCRAGFVKDANEIYKEMCKNGTAPNVTTYNTLISAACRHGQGEKALKLLLKMGENSCEPDSKTYPPLLKLCCKKRWMNILLYLLGHMFKKDVGLDLGTYTLLVQGLCRNGELEQSCILFQEMVLRGITPKHQTYTKLLEALEAVKLDSAKAKIEQLMMIHAEPSRKNGNLHFRSCSWM